MARDRNKLPKQVKDELARILSHPQGARGRLLEIERERGSLWEFPLDTADWEHGLVMIRGLEARIVLLDARWPGTGALKRLLASIRKAGLMPVVVEPNARLTAILSRWGWKGKDVGSGFDSWTEWRP